MELVPALTADGGLKQLIRMQWVSYYFGGIPRFGKYSCSDASVVENLVCDLSR